MLKRIFVMNEFFNTVSWSYGSNIYEVNIRQYTPQGTFAAFAKHLPRLKEMGVEILWLMPITPISVEKRQGNLGSYYACRSYTDINPEFGSFTDFNALIAYAHELQFKLIIDWVANHTGCDHIWTTEHPTWYVKDENGNFTERYGWEDVIDLNYEVPALRAAMIESMKFWIREFDLDGFRCDMAHLVPLDFWKEARRACETVKPLFWLAECEVAEYHKVFDVSYAWEWMHISEKLIKQTATLEDFKSVLLKYSSYPAGARKLLFTANHDENSWNGTEYEKYGEAAKTLAVFSCTWPGIPLVYSGQELPNLRRLKFFDKDAIEWREPVALHEFYQLLLLLRKQNPAFDSTAALIQLETNADDKVLAYLLIEGESKVLILLNLSSQSKLKCILKDERLNALYYNWFSGISHSINNLAAFELQAWEYIVYSTVSPR